MGKAVGALAKPVTSLVREPLQAVGLAPEGIDFPQPPAPPEPVEMPDPDSELLRARKRKAAATQLAQSGGRLATVGQTIFGGGTSQKLGG